MTLKVSNILQEKLLMQPPETMKEMGQHLLEITKKLSNVDTEQEQYVAVSYYLRDIIPHIGKVRSGITREMLFINLLFVELLADLALFHTRPNKDTCGYFLGKYTRYLVAEEDPGTAGFYHWLFCQYKDKPGFDYRSHLQEAGAGSLFVIMHEWSHTHDDLVEDVAKVLLESKYLQEMFPNKNDDVLKEVCCDYSALVLCSQQNWEQSFGCDKTEMLSLAMLSLFVSGVYDFLSNIRINVAMDQVNKPAEKLFEILNTRLWALAIAVKVSHQSRLFFEEQDALSALTYAGSTINDFLKESGKFYTESLFKKIDEYNSMTEEERAQYSFTITDSDWYLLA